MIFSAPMVPRLLDGSKTETRRLQGLEAVNVSPNQWGLNYSGHTGIHWVAKFSNGKEGITCRARAAPGDSIWAKETFRLGHKSEVEPEVIYRSDNPDVCGAPWTPSIYMPRRYSRIDLFVTAVRVERLCDIGKDGRKAVGVLAEGITREQIVCWEKWLHIDDAPAHTYGVLWESINGKGSWSKNPWVWVYQFTTARNPAVYGGRNCRP